MRAAVLESQGSIRVKEIPEPDCGAEEAVLKVESCAVCGSDLRIYNYGNERVKTPAIMGHEIAGIVEKVGAKVLSLRPGDRVALGADVPCGTCYWCVNGMGTNCAINYAIGYQFPGGFEAKMLLNETILKYGPVTKIPDRLSYDEAALAEPLACAINGLELANMSVGKSMCVIGLGPIGCMMLELSRAFGASRVFAVQRSRARLEMARKFREDATFLSAEDSDPVEAVLSATGGEGVDLVITTAGTVKAHEDAIRMVRHRGYVNLFGGLKNQPKLSIDSNLIHYKECYIMGSHGSLPRHHRIAVDMIANGTVRAREYISRIFPLGEIEAALAFHQSGQGLKTIVKPGL
jgi:L-iditol 2-dehydrogenase